MDQYGNANAARRTDEFGNQGQQGYGHETGVPGTGTCGAVTHGSGGGGGGTAQMIHPERHQQEKKGGILHRSGSSSSSSSDEDDGMGGRRKKGLKEKIKEKLPGQHQKNDEFGQPIQGQGQGHTATGYGGTGTGTGIGAGGYHDPEKRGVVDKVKEKLPGHQNQRTDEYGQPIQGQGHTTGHGGTGTGYGGTGIGTGNGGYHEPEKRGVVDKVKEKLPGHQTQRTDEYGQPIQGQGHTTGHGGTGTGTGYGGTGTGTAGYREPEKKGMMEKIKEKLPGQH